MAFGWHSVDRAGVASGQAPLAQPSGPPAQRWPPTWLSTPTDPRQFAASESSVRHRALCIVGSWRRASASQVLLTDGNPDLLDRTRVNVKRNLDSSDRAAVKVQRSRGASRPTRRCSRASLWCWRATSSTSPLRGDRWLPAFASCSGQRRGRCSSPRQATRRRRPSRASQASRRAPRVPACALTASSGWATARPCSSARGEGARCGC